MRYRVVVEGRPYEIEISDDAGNPGTVWVDGVAHDVDLTEANGQPYHSLLLDARSYETQLRRDAAGGLQVVVKGRTHSTQLQANLAGAAATAESVGAQTSKTAGPQAWLKAPLPGLIVEIRVSIGDRVSPGDVVAVIESMKMHLEIRAPRAGIVQTLSAQPGQEVDLDEVLAIIS